jgi:hypothetical protein
MRGCVVLAAALCVGVSFDLAHAATLESYQVGNWQAAAYSDDQSGAFTHCTMSAFYSTGSTLLFSISGNFAWSVGVLNNAWNLPADSAYNVTYSIDGSMPSYSSGKAATSNEIDFPLPADEGLYNRLRYGSQITISVMGQQLFFTLEGTQRGLGSLLDCAQRHAAAPPATAGNAPKGPPPGGTAPTPLGTASAAPGAAPSASKPPAPGAQGVPAPASPVASSLTVDAVALMANVLAQSGVSGYRLAQSSEVPPELAGYQAVWTAPNLTGYLAVPSSPATGNISGDLIARDAKACSGNFSSGTLADDKSGAPNAGVVRVYTSCDAGSGAAVTYYTVLPKSGGGQYIFAEIGAAGSQNVAQDAEAKVRKAAGTLIQ